MRKIVVILIIVFITLLGISYLFLQSKNTFYANNSNAIKFTGIVTETVNGCPADGICSFKVDDKWVIAEEGGLRPPNSDPLVKGRLIGLSVYNGDIKKYIGNKVEVFAEQTGNGGYTIYGNKNYYIKLLPQP